MYRKALLFFWVICLFISCEKQKTFDQIIKDGKNTFVAENEWKLKFEKITTLNGKIVESENQEFVVCIESITNSKKYEVSMKNLSNSEIREMSFDDFEKILKNFNKKFLTEHEIEKIKSENPTAKVKTSGSNYATRKAKSNEFDEIFSKQNIIYIEENSKKSITISFTFEKILK